MTSNPPYALGWWHKRREEHLFVYLMTTVSQVIAEMLVAYRTSWHVLHIRRNAVFTFMIDNLIKAYRVSSIITFPALTIMSHEN
jgi:hypothetical protein